MKTLRTIAVTNIAWSFICSIFMMFRLPVTFATAFGAGDGAPRTASRYEMILVPLITMVVQILCLFIFKEFIKKAHAKNKYSELGAHMVGRIVSSGVLVTGFLTGLSVAFNYAMYAYARSKSPGVFVFILIVLGFIGLSFLMYRGALEEMKQRVDAA